MPTAEGLAEWFRRQGLRTFRSESVYWVMKGPRVLDAFPYHRLVSPSDSEISSILNESGAIAVRFSTPLQASEGRLSYHTVIESKLYSLERLPSSKSRNNVKHGLRACEVSQVSFDRLATEGWALQRDTLARQRRVAHRGRSEWESMCLAARDVDGFEAWAALVRGELAASIIAYSCEGWYYILYQQSDRRFLREQVNNALAFEVTRRFCDRDDCQAIFYGLHSLDAPTSLDEFKFRLGYQAKPVRQRVVVRPAALPLFSGPASLVWRAMRAAVPKSERLAKAEGLVRFYREGKRPLDEQEPPPGLARAGTSAVQCSQLDIDR